MLNADKIVVGLKDYIDYNITSEWIKADPKEIHGILEMTRPSDDAGVRLFFGMVQYMARSSTLEPTSKYTRKNSEFVWSVECEQGFQEVNKT